MGMAVVVMVVGERGDGGDGRQMARGSQCALRGWW